MATKETNLRFKPEPIINQTEWLVYKSPQIEALEARGFERINANRSPNKIDNLNAASREVSHK